MPSGVGTGTGVEATTDRVTEAEAGAGAEAEPGAALALAALKELEFDHRTGTVSDEDYRAQVGPLRREVAAALQALQPGAGEGPPPAARN